jgi:RNA polymerase sigma-70 factor (ECF subfamily)
MSEVTDAELIARCRDGQSRAFDELIRRYERPVYNVALRMLRNAEDARDVAQSAFLKAFEHLNGYDPKYRFFSWIYRIAINEALDVRGGRRRYEAVDESLPEPGPGPDGSVGDDQLTRQIDRVIAGMKPEYQAVLLLRHFADLSYEQMAAALELPEKTVKSRLFTARQIMREQFEREGLL